MFYKYLMNELDFYTVVMLLRYALSIIVLHIIKISRCCLCQRDSWGQHLRMSSTFSTAKLNRTCFSEGELTQMMQRFALHNWSAKVFCCKTNSMLLSTIIVIWYLFHVKLHTIELGEHSERLSIHDLGKWPWYMILILGVLSRDPVSFWPVFLSRDFFPIPENLGK